MNLPDWFGSIFQGLWWLCLFGIYISTFPVLEKAFQKNFVIGLLILLFPVIGGIWVGIEANKGRVDKFYRTLFQCSFLGMLLLSLFANLNITIFTHNQ